MSVRRALLLVLIASVAARCAVGGEGTVPAVPALAPLDLASVIPAPAQVAPDSGRFTIRDGGAILVPPGAEGARIARYFAALVRASHGVALKVQAGNQASPRTPPIQFRLAACGPGTPAELEGYRLEVSSERVLVSARCPQGLFYGAVTLWQLVSVQPLTDGAIMLPALRIEDAPRFGWRGLMLDSARHFQSPEFVMHYIDWMALHKLNVLGWHLTDDQGWRLEIKKYPRLTAVGAYRVPAGRAAQRDIDPATGQPRRYGGFYTQAQVRRIVRFARERFVRIVPEIDLPGHATAALVAYPALAARPDELPAAVPSDWGIYPNLLNIDESTFRFLGAVFDELLTLFPGPYVHVGGDEVVTGQWQSSPGVQARMRALGLKDVAQVQGYFERRLGEYLSAHGRRLIGWDEIVNAGLGPNATVLSWRGVDGAIAAAQAGHDAVLAPDPVMYLDHRQGSSPAEPPGRGPVITTEQVYRLNPLPGALAGLREHVLGLQANLWTEHVRTEAQAAYMTWPRAAALAEVGWSVPERFDWNGFRARLPAEFDRFRTLGIHYSDDVFAPPRVLGPWERHMSQDLNTCSDKVVLNLEDDAPLKGPRAVFLIDIEDPCWILPGVDLAHGATLTVAAGQLPFNFQIGKDRDQIRLDPPRSAAGELEVRVDGCDGAPLALLALAPAADNDAVTELPAAPLPHLAGSHDLCLRFAQHGLNPLWAIDWVQLSQ